MATSKPRKPATTAASDTPAGMLRVYQLVVSDVHARDIVLGNFVVRATAEVYRGRYKSRPAYAKHVLRIRPATIVPSIELTVYGYELMAAKA